MSSSIAQKSVNVTHFIIGISLAPQQDQMDHWLREKARALQCHV
jgi:hypothetical protein